MTRISELVRCFLGPEPEVIEEITVVYVSLGSVRLVVGCSLVDIDTSFWLEVVSMIPLPLVVDGGVVDGGVVGAGVVDTDILFWSIVVFSLSVSSVVVKGVVLTFFVKKWVCLIVSNVCTILFGNGLKSNVIGQLWDNGTQPLGQCRSLAVHFFLPCVVYVGLTGTR